MQYYVLKYFSNVYYTLKINGYFTQISFKVGAQIQLKDIFALVKTIDKFYQKWIKLENSEHF